MLTTDIGMFRDGVLILVRHLVNGRSVAGVAVARVATCMSNCRATM